ncbi:MAG TPA: amidohydrolase family protein [Vicinamibacterales bacterium]|nr:amidohydrolase family protein [Vicinamibacterales bacterium]
MNTARFCVAAMVAALALSAAAPTAAQDLAITNARIIVGNGQIVNSGTIVVRGGKIVSASAGAAGTQGLRVIDAKGMSAVPGFIDAHKHVNTGPQEKEQMQALLEAGYTTVLSGGGPGDGNITLRDRIEAGTINGPRIIPSERVNLRGTPDEARAAIRAMAAKGIKHTGEIALTPLPGPTAEEIAVLKAIVDEAAKAGVQVNVHAVSTPAMVAAVDAGVRRLVHLPNKDFTSHEAAAKLAKTGTIALGTVGFGAPIFGVFASDNNPRFRDGKPWPEAIAGANRDAAGRALGTEAAYPIVNARTIWDNGGLIGYCTDTNYEPLAGLEHELKSYSIVFSMQDIFKLMGPNTAAYIGMGDQLGTLEAGKLADIVLLDGNPMEGIHNMLKTKVVVKGGKVVVDKR